MHQFHLAQHEIHRGAGRTQMVLDLQHPIQRVSGMKGSSFRRFRVWQDPSRGHHSAGRCGQLVQAIACRFAYRRLQPLAQHHLSGKSGIRQQGVMQVMASPATKTVCRTAFQAGARSRRLSPPQRNGRHGFPAAPAPAGRVRDRWLPRAVAAASLPTNRRRAWTSVRRHRHRASRRSEGSMAAAVDSARTARCHGPDRRNASRGQYGRIEIAKSCRRQRITKRHAARHRGSPAGRIRAHASEKPLSDRPCAAGRTYTLQVAKFTQQGHQRWRRKMPRRLSQHLDSRLVRRPANPSASAPEHGKRAPAHGRSRSSAP